MRDPTSGTGTLCFAGPHLGLIVDLQRGEFRAPEEKLIALAKVARSLLGRAASDKRWLPTRQLASFAGKAQFLYLAITPARFFLRELHCVLATRQGWGGARQDDKPAAPRSGMVDPALANLTSRSPVMMEELRKLLHLLDVHDISIRPRYIQSAANVWADRLSREPDDSDWQLNPRIFAYLQRLWGPRTVDRFASKTRNFHGRAMAVQPSLQYNVQYPSRLSHARRARYRLAVRPGSEAPWTASMAAELRSLLGTDDVGQAALGLLTGSLAAGTYRNCDSGMRSFATFCEQEGLRPLQATTNTIVRYTAWLGMQGTVGAESLQQYYSSINKYFRDHQRQPVALGEMVADARRGLAIQQERLAAEDVRVALPAPVAADILDTAIELRRTLVWEPANIADIRAFRAALATITAYVFVCRAESGISCETDLPMAAVPDFADLLDWYTISRDAYSRRFYGASPPPKFWSISPLESSATLVASCVGVPLPAIKHMGDWSKNSDVVTGKYIDPTMRPTPAAWRFFGWLVPVRPPA
eukprot:jgi/Tetstr1/421868/TSEL_012768.t1